MNYLGWRADAMFALMAGRLAPYLGPTRECERCYTNCVLRNTNICQGCGHYQIKWDPIDFDKTFGIHDKCNRYIHVDVISNQDQSTRFV
jgi:hypothetical protein